jgi:hypothetical protein
MVEPPEPLPSATAVSEPLGPLGEELHGRAAALEREAAPVTRSDARPGVPAAGTVSPAAFVTVWVATTTYVPGLMSAGIFNVGVIFRSRPGLGLVATTGPLRPPSRTVTSEALVPEL